MYKFVLLILTVMLSGCGNPVTIVNDIQPNIYTVPVNKSVNLEQGKKTTWDSVLSEFSNSNFHIERNNMHAYQVAMRTQGQPEMYIDCGTRTIDTEGHVVTINNASRKFSYKMWRHNHIDTYSVKNEFTGFVNLIVTGNEFSSRISTQYELELKTHVVRTSTQGHSHNIDENFIMRISSDKVGYSQALNNNCRSTGKLEQEVLQIIEILPPPLESVPRDNQSFGEQPAAGYQKGF